MTAEVDRGSTTPRKTIAAINRLAMPGLVERYPGVTVGLGGEQEERADSVAALASA